MQKLLNFPTRRFHALLIVGLLALASVSGHAVHAGESVVNINEASALVLAQHLHGVGEATASRIVAYRETNGPFQRVDDLVLVRGIGERLLERNRARVVVTVSEVADGDPESVAKTE